jgi:hypothetical protein
MRTDPAEVEWIYTRKPSVAALKTASSPDHHRTIAD